MSDDRSSIAVLLVDDQRIVAVAIGRLLASEPGVVFHHCDSSASAVARANLIQPALILQDLVMPDIDGLALVGLYRANPATAATPVVVLSGNDDAKTRALATAAGADDFLVKMPTKERLIACVRRHAFGQRAGEMPASHAPAASLATDGNEVRLKPDTAYGSLDPEVMAAFREGSADFTLRLIDQFGREATSRVDTLTDAARSRDVPALRSAAHSLKGSSMIVGASRLAALCVRLEGCLDGDPSGAGASALASAFDEELAQVLAALARERQDIELAGRQVLQQASNPASGSTQP